MLVFNMPGGNLSDPEEKEPKMDIKHWIQNIKDGTVVEVRMWGNIFGILTGKIYVDEHTFQVVSISEYRSSFTISYDVVDRVSIKESELISIDLKVWRPV